MASKKERDLAFGRFAEDLANQHYIQNGHVVLERNWRLNKTEIDLIVRKNDTIVFVEVKARSGEDEDPLEAVTRDKMKRMMRAADTYIRSLTGDNNFQFDLVTVTGDFNDYKMEVYSDAFLPTELL